MKNELLKKVAIAAGAIVLFLALAYGFVPQVLQGQIVNQSDISGYVGMSQEMNEWNRQHPDDPTYWTGSMFSGMPTTAISTRNGGDLTQPLYDLLLTGKRPATYLFIALLGAFLMMLAFGVSWPLALGGAVAVAFCSYNFQIIQVGHNTKMQAIAFFPWVVAAVAYTYKSAISDIKEDRRELKWDQWLPATVAGSVLFALTLSFQIKANHQQITWYLAGFVLLYALAEAIYVIAKKRDALLRFIIASALLLVIGIIGIATNVNKLLPLYKYTEETMRGGSELSGSGNSGEGGLDLGYATAWSYGWEELPNLMIPNFNGGASAGAVNPDKSETIRLLKRAGQGNLKETAKNLPLYWGPQPFTAGPMYMGAITVFLFILGLFLCKGREKWWLLAATILAVMLSLGSHMMAFTKLCFKVLPLYNKFRTVSMALIVLQVSMPLLGFIALDGILKGSYDFKAFKKASIAAFAITAGFCLAAWLVPGIAGDFSAASDAGMQDVLVSALQADRRMLLRNDALSGFLLITVSFAFLLWASRPGARAESRRWIAAGIICSLCLISLFSVGKRYLNADDFTTPRAFSKQFDKRPVDEFILSDEDPSFRVLDLSVNTFNDSHPSYFHKSIGGYSPAKLQRYQDLIEHYLSKEINSIFGSIKGAATISDVQAALPKTPVLDALNTRYIIIGGDYPPVVNESAKGNAWFVDRIAAASGPDEEIALLGAADLGSTAIVGKDYISYTEGITLSGAAEGAIELTDYTPKSLRYRYSCPEDKVVVFSEIFYPRGWKAVVDPDSDNSVEIPVFRADWTLRAAMLPKGDHELLMTFEPESYRTGAAISRASSAALLVLLALSLFGAAYIRRRTGK